MTITLNRGKSGRVKNLREYLNGLTKEHIISVLNDFTFEMAKPFGFLDSTDYDLVYNGKRFPPKAVLGIAAKHLYGNPLKSNDFSGGESSACFSILKNLGFEIQSKTTTLTSLPEKPNLYKCYERENIAQLFEPTAKFQRGSGRWGITGIIESPKDSKNFIFIVTLGKPIDGNPYKDSLTEDGYLIWESQTRHNFDSKVIKQLLAHDSSVNNIHLFIRPKDNQPYRYFGLLDYFSHDQTKVNPVHFIWRLMSWEVDKNQLNSFGFKLSNSLNPTFSLLTNLYPIPKLSKVDKPKSKKTTRKTTRKNIKNNPENCDWEVKDARNRALGLLGEKLVIEYEKARLIEAKRPDLADEILHTAEHNSAAGYDIKSFHIDGSSKFIEVKTTEGPINTPFFISINEVKTSINHGVNYSIYRVFALKKESSSAQFYEIVGSAENTCLLEPINFRATFLV